MLREKQLIDINFTYVLPLNRYSLLLFTRHKKNNKL